MSKKSNLFKFVTLKNPQVLNEDRNKQRLRFRSNTEESVFNNMASETLLESYYSKLRAALLKLNSFSNWYNTYNVKLNSVENKRAHESQKMTELSDLKINSLWNDLVSETIMNQPTSVRESIIRMLVSNQVVTGYNDRILTHVIGQMIEASEKFERQAKANAAMAFNSYPYFYEEENYWEDFLQSSNGVDVIIKDSLQSGISKSVEEDYKGLEDALNWYITIEENNTDKEYINPDGELFFSLVDDMNSINDVVEDTWEGHGTATLTIIHI